MKVTNNNLIKDIAKLPIEIVNRMLINQERQGNKLNV